MNNPERTEINLAFTWDVVKYDFGCVQEQLRK